jgi:hypothetical protein
MNAENHVVSFALQHDRKRGANWGKCTRIREQVDEHLANALAIHIDCDWLKITFEGKPETDSSCVGFEYLLAQLNQIAAFWMHDELAGLDERAVEQVANKCVHCFIGGEKFTRSLIYLLLKHLCVQCQGLLLFLNLSSQLAYLDGTMQGSHEVDTINGFLDEIVRPTPYSLDYEILIGVAGDEQCWNLRSQFL